MLESIIRNTLRQKSISNNKKVRKPRAKRKQRGFLQRLASIPLWGFLVGALMAAGLYSFVLFYYFVDPYSFQWKAIYGEPTFPEGYSIRGIDISHYQQKIDWEILRNASMNNDPISFIIIKATEGVSLVDDNFNENFFLSRRNGFIRGAYHFMTPDVPAKRQAEFFLHQVHLEEGDLPPVLDIENKRKWEGKSKAEVQKMAKEWLDIVEKHYGVKPILYTSVSFRRDILDAPEFDQYPFWMAHYYVDTPTYQGDWHFWQHTDCGKVDGIKGFVDCNIFFGSFEQLNALLIKE